MSVTLSFNSLKGGVGKTTCAILFARVLRDAGYAVLLVDLDPQYSLTSYYAEGDPPEGRSLVTYLGQRSVRLAEVLLLHDGLSVLGGSVELVDYNIARRLRKDSYALRKKFERDGVEETYDFIIIDTPPTFSFLNSLSLPLADRIFLVTVPEIWSVRAVSHYLEALRQFTRDLDTRYEDVHLVVNRYAKDQRADTDTLAALVEKYSEYYTGPPIPTSAALRNFLLNKKNYKQYFHRVEEPIRTIV